MRIGRASDAGSLISRQREKRTVMPRDEPSSGRGTRSRQKALMVPYRAGIASSMFAEPVFPPGSPELVRVGVDDPVGPNSVAAIRVMRATHWSCAGPHFRGSRGGAPRVRTLEDLGRPSFDGRLSRSRSRRRRKWKSRHASTMSTSSRARSVMTSFIGRPVYEGGTAARAPATRGVPPGRRRETRRGRRRRPRRARKPRPRTPLHRQRPVSERSSASRRALRASRTRRHRHGASEARLASACR